MEIVQLPTTKCQAPRYKAIINACQTYRQKTMQMNWSHL